MASRGRQHELLKIELNLVGPPARPTSWSPRKQLCASAPTTSRSPSSSSIRDRSCRTMSAAKVLLVVEIAESSLPSRPQHPAHLYASFGVRDDDDPPPRASRACIANPAPAGYASVTEHAADEVLTPLLAPALAVRLADLA